MNSRKHGEYSEKSFEMQTVECFGIRLLLTIRKYTFCVFIFS